MATPRQNQNATEPAPLRVLSIDGGGMKGLYTSTLLAELARLYAEGTSRGPLDVGKAFDLIAGTSTGGILGSALAFGLTPERISNLYIQHGPAIFPNPVPHNTLGRIWWMLTHLFRPGSLGEELRVRLEEIFKDESLSQMYERRGIALCLPAVSLTDHSPRVFKTPHLDRLKLDLNLRLADACLATSAAPIILPLAHIRNPHGSDKAEAFIDGGLWANSPVLVALTEALEMAEPNQTIEILSLGVIALPIGNVIAPDDTSWGIAKWKAGVGPLESSLEAQSRASFKIAEFLSDRLRTECVIHRHEPSPPPLGDARWIGLDNASPKSIRTLVAIGESDAKNLFGQATRGQTPLGSFINSLFRDMLDSSGNTAKTREYKEAQ